MVVQDEHSNPHRRHTATSGGAVVTRDLAFLGVRGVTRRPVPPLSWVVVQPTDRIDDPVRLRRLVKAILILDAELQLPVVLRRIVEEACELVDARYGALGVLSEDGSTLDQLVTVGPQPGGGAGIGTRPTGQGVLGTVIADDKPVRLADISASPDSIGVPEHHPPMTSFLGVPIRVHGEVMDPST